MNIILEIEQIQFVKLSSKTNLNLQFLELFTSCDFNLTNSSEPLSTVKPKFFSSDVLYCSRVWDCLCSFSS